MNNENLEFCRENIEQMLKRSQTKVIFPIITFGLVKAYQDEGKRTFSDTEIRKCYEEAVRYMENYLKHDLHIGGEYYDAYPSRNLPKYGVLKALGNKRYELLAPYTTNAEILTTWIPEKINQHIANKLGIIPQLESHNFRAENSASKDMFLNIEAVQQLPSNR